MLQTPKTKPQISTCNVQFQNDFLDINLFVIVNKFSTLFYEICELYNIICRETLVFGSNLELTKSSLSFVFQSIGFLFSPAHYFCVNFLNIFLLGFLSSSSVELISQHMVALISSCKVSKGSPCKVFLAPGRWVFERRSPKNFLSPRPLGRRERMESRRGKVHLRRLP